MVVISKCPTASCASSTLLARLSGFPESRDVYSSDAMNPFLKLTFTTSENHFGPGFSANWNLGAQFPVCGINVPCLSGQYLIDGGGCKPCTTGTYKTHAIVVLPQMCLVRMLRSCTRTAARAYDDEFGQCEQDLCEYPAGHSRAQQMHTEPLVARRAGCVVHSTVKRSQSTLNAV